MVIFVHAKNNDIVRDGLIISGEITYSISSVLSLRIVKEHFRFKVLGFIFFLVSLIPLIGGMGEIYYGYSKPWGAIIFGVVLLILSFATFSAKAKYSLVLELKGAAPNLTIYGDYDRLKVVKSKIEAELSSANQM